MADYSDFDAQAKDKGTGRGAFFGLISLVAVFSLAGAWGFSYFKEKTERASYERDYENLSFRFAKEVPMVTKVEDEAGYRAAVYQLVGKFFTRHRMITKKYPDISHVWDDKVKLTIADKKVENRSMDAQGRERFQRVWDMVDAKRKELKKSYKFVYTRESQGLRFDVVSVEPQRDALRFNFNLIGLPQALIYQSLTFEIFNENGTKIGGATSQGAAPAMLVEKPTNQIPQFPPMIQFGYYDFPKVPKIITHINLVFEFTLRTNSGSEIPIKFAFEKLEVPANWKLGDGQLWSGKNEEEMQELSDALDKEAKKLARKEKRQKRR